MTETVYIDNMLLGDTPLCQCGCNKKVRLKHHKYIVGHNRKEKKNPKTKEGIRKWKISMWVRKWIPVPGWLFFMDNPLCACGCGDHVNSPHDKYIHRHGTKGIKRPDITGRVPWNKDKTNDPNSPNYDLRIKASWNKDLTKETDPRVANTSKSLKGRPQPPRQVAKMRDTKLQMFESGELVVWNKGLKTGPLSEEHIQALRLSHMGHEVTKNTRKKIGQRNKAYWESLSPEEQKDYLNNSFFKSRKKPNNEENLLIPILSQLGFTYNTVAIVGPLRPDFVNLDKKYIIEYDGHGGHGITSPHYNPLRDDHRDQLYCNANFIVMRLYPEDLKLGEQHIVKIVKEYFL